MLSSICGFLYSLLRIPSWLSIIVPQLGYASDIYYPDFQHNAEKGLTFVLTSPFLLSLSYGRKKNG